MAGKNPNISLAKDAFVGNTLAFIGFILVLVLLIFGAVGFSTGLDSPVKIIVVILVDFIILVFIALNILMIAHGVKRIMLVQRFRVYAAYLASDPYHSIDQLAAAKGITTEKAKNRLLEMINRGYFGNAYIDFDRNRVVFMQEGTPAKPAASPLQTTASVEYISVTCHGCGATNNLQKGSTAPCDFCGNSLSGS